MNDKVQKVYIVDDETKVYKGLVGNGWNGKMSGYNGASSRTWRETPLIELTKIFMNVFGWLILMKGIRFTNQGARLYRS
jgi:hypothetical protein